MIPRFDARPPADPDASPPGSLPARDGVLLDFLQGSSSACLVLDASQKIQSWNEAAAMLLGWAADEACGRPFSSFFASGEKSRKCNLVKGLCRPRHFRFQDKAGDVLALQIQGVPLPADRAGTISYVLLLQNVTERVFLEEALLHAIEREQRRIGQELHDHLCQHLLGAAFAAKALAGDLEREHSPHAPKLNDLARLINEAVFDVRDLSRGLHPVELDAAGLMSALQHLANRAGQSAACVFHCGQHVLVKSTQAALNAYRIAQETVTAALQSTEAKKIEMRLSQSRNRICLEISDDGKKEGRLTANPASVEAKTLHYRAKAMKGTLSMQFDPREGTRVTCLFPA